MDIKKIYDYVEGLFPGFGLNKRNEVVRLLYEISKRQGIGFDAVFNDEIQNVKDFGQIKAYLLPRRYPSLTQDEYAALPSQTEVVLPQEDRVGAPQPLSFPRQVLYEKEIAGNEFLNHLHQRLPDAKFQEIPSYRQYVKGLPFSLSDYNRRTETLFVIREKYDFFQHCPCSAASQPCVYHIMNAGFGCAFDCVYCYLQAYTNAPGLTIPGNLDEILERFSSYSRPGMRLGTGQFTDSLVYDHLTGFSRRIIDYFRERPDVTFEFKTKSDRVDGIFATPSAPNIVVAWSLNPQNMIDMVEHRTSSLSQRLTAAKRCAAAGYHIAFHFDPIIFYDGWEKDYSEVVQQMFQHVPADRIAWISLGTLRMTMKLRQVIERRFPESIVLETEHVVGFDGKLRYPKRLRRHIYETMMTAVREHSEYVCVYLCMEDPKLNTALKIKPVLGCSR